MIYEEVRPDPAPLPLAPRETASHFVLIRPFTGPMDGKKKATVYIQKGDFFREQGGLTDEWGENWVGIKAESLNDARLKAHASEGTGCPLEHLIDGQGIL